MHHNKTLFIVIVVILVPIAVVVLTAANRGFVYRDPLTELTTTKTNDCPSNTLTYEVNQLLEKNNIDLSRLNSINPEGTPLLGYSNNPTGFTYSLVDYRLETGGVESSQHVDLRACYNDRQILTGGIRLAFKPDGTLRSAFDFNFSPTNVSPTPALSEGAARTAAYRAQPALKGVAPVLGYYDLNAGGGGATPDYILAWEFRDVAHVVVNAHTGAIVRSFNGVTE